MPYQILRLPNTNKYSVKSINGTILSKGTTLSKAKQQVKIVTNIETKTKPKPKPKPKRKPTK